MSDSKDAGKDTKQEESVELEAMPLTSEQESTQEPVKEEGKSKESDNEIKCETIKSIRWGFVFGIACIAMFVMLWFVTCENRILENSNIKLQQSLVEMEFRSIASETKIKSIILEKDREFKKSVSIFDERLNSIGSTIISAESALQLLAEQIDTGKESIKMMIPAAGDMTSNPKAKEAHVIDGTGKVEAVPTTEDTTSTEKTIKEPAQEVSPVADADLNKDVVDGLQAEPYYSVAVPVK